MDEFLETLYRQYNDLIRQQAHINLNLTKIGELILLNKGTIPDSNRKPVTERPAPAEQPVKLTVSKDVPPYDVDMNWQDKISYALKLMGKPVTAKQIAAKIREMEPNSAQSVEKSVELTTSRMSKAGVIGAKKDGVKNYYHLLSGVVVSRQVAGGSEQGLAAEGSYSSQGQTEEPS